MLSAALDAGGAHMKSTVLLLLTALAATPWSLHAQNTAVDYLDGCERGDLVTCTVLGLIYETGAAGARNMPRAVELYRRSCSRGVRSACQRLEFAESRDSGADAGDELVRVGYVADAFDGSPIAGALVRVHGVRGIGERRHLTDEAGRVVMDPLPRGRHPIDVQRGGYQMVDGDVPVPWDTDFLILMERVSEGEAPDEGQIFGQVTEEGSGAGIATVDITVSGENTVRTISNGQGRFQLSALEPGPVVVEFRRLGYEPRTVTVTIQPGRTAEVYATLSTEPIELAPIEVTVASRYLERSGFYARAENGWGDRFTHRDIERMNAVAVGDILRRVAGVTVVSAQIGTGSEAISNRRRAGTDGGRCRLLPYYNGTPLVDFNLELMPPDEIEALEVYQGPNVPIEYVQDYQPAGPSCGVVLIWTRDPQRRD
jgi:hypothetical protein